MIALFGSINIDLIFTRDHLFGPVKNVLGPAARGEPAPYVSDTKSELTRSDCKL